MERFDLERKVDFAYMLRSFTLLQMEHADHVKQHWESLLPSIQVITSSLHEPQQSLPDDQQQATILPNLNDTTTTTTTTTTAEQVVDM